MSMERDIERVVSDIHYLVRRATKLGATVSFDYDNACLSYAGTRVARGYEDSWHYLNQLQSRLSKERIDRALSYRKQ